ncbi:hypothetical protein DFP72DRAFT_892839 [Ephemerocybe angulata]|uniref:Uncharacterized protein n=1 Tax=Ephemerocybe angulata TaxID=980116 RepID=A0A8H6I3V1_9AGAR|nr:hypothetical protein DFP72DRAFT_892839 [Tulosesus angulatus]
MAITYPDAAFIGTLLAELFLGVYVVTFGLYVKILRVRKAPLHIVDYGVIALFILGVTTIVTDAVQQFFTLMRGGAPWTEKVNSATSTLSLTMDFLSQAILIYRCWIVWGQRYWVIALPAALTLTSYATGLVVTIDLASSMNSFEVIAKDWWVPLGTTSMGLSLGVNALVSGLMIGRILYVYRQSHGSSPGAVARASLAVSVLVESAIALFFAQLVFLVLYKIESPAFSLVGAPVAVIYGLNCTVIMVRVGMNHSYETTMVHGSTTDVNDTTHQRESASNNSQEKLESPV